MTAAPMRVSSPSPIRVIRAGVGTSRTSRTMASKLVMTLKRISDNGYFTHDAQGQENKETKNTKK